MRPDKHFSEMHTEIAILTLHGHVESFREQVAIANLEHAISEASDILMERTKDEHGN